MPVNRLGVMLAGDEPAPPVVLAWLVDVLELRDPAVGDRPLIWAVQAAVVTLAPEPGGFSVADLTAKIAAMTGVTGTPPARPPTT